MELMGELLELPQALRSTADWAADGGLAQAAPPSRPLLTGMGASFHAAWIGALMLRRVGIAANYEEASDVLLYSHALLEEIDLLVYLSQSGSSAEVQPMRALLPEPARWLALTNDLTSPLARHAGLALPLNAGQEQWIASKTFANTLALLWLLAQRWGGAPLEPALDTIRRLADRAAQIQQGAGAAVERLDGLFAAAQRVVFLGHGPHAATARQAAMTLSEWPKRAAYSHGIGAYRHGFIESAEEGSAVLLFSAPGPAHDSTLALGRELRSYGVQVLRIENGLLLELDAPPAAQPVDEFLSPILDMLPLQLFAEADARRRLETPGFRYIQKVVTNF